IPLGPPQSDRVCRTASAAVPCRKGEQSRGVRQSPVCRTGSSISSALLPATRCPPLRPHVRKGLDRWPPGSPVVTPWEIYHIRMLSEVLRRESPAVDARPALSTSDSTWLD